MKVLRFVPKGKPGVDCPLVEDAGDEMGVESVTPEILLRAH